MYAAGKHNNIIFKKSNHAKNSVTYATDPLRVPLFQIIHTFPVYTRLVGSICALTAA